MQKDIEMNDLFTETNEEIRRWLAANDARMTDWIACLNTDKSWWEYSSQRWLMLYTVRADNIKDQLTGTSNLLPIHSSLLVDYMCTNFGTEYLIIIDNNMIK